MADALFLRLLADDDKGAALHDTIQSLRAGEDSSAAFAVDPASFEQVPGAPFAYWVSEDLKSVFRKLPVFESAEHVARRGPSTGDDARRVRLWWEVNQNQSWVPLSKGGAYSPFYSDIHLLVAWDESRRTFRDFYGRPGRMIERPESLEFFFRPGITWPRRTTRGISIRVLPKGCIFADKGPAAFAPDQVVLPLLALMNTRAFEGLVVLQVAAADTAARSYEVGIIQRTPVPDLSGAEATKLGQLALACVNLKRNLDTANEISHVFQLAALLQVPGETLAQRVQAWQSRVAETEQQLAAHQREIDDIAFTLYGIAGEDRRAIEASLSRGSAEAASDAESSEPGDDEGEPTAPTTDSRPLVVDLLSYAVGCAFGRWDVRFATGERAFAELADPFAPLPVYAPGALTPESDLAGYPLTIDDDGILVDDIDHPDDIARRVHHLLELLWGTQADAIVQEACAVLGVKDVRDYLRKGFFDDHIRRYSKSRRKAPIYWLLQSPKRAYGLWLSYHRMDADMLFKALMHYVEPKLRLEQDQLDALRQQRQEFGSGGKEARQVEKLLAQQETLVTDVQEFRDRLERTAKYYLMPDLNDGVVLTIAPLWELVPWKEAKTYWNELLAGKYEWSSIGKQLQQKGLVK